MVKKTRPGRPEQELIAHRPLKIKAGPGVLLPGGIQAWILPAIVVILTPSKGAGYLIEKASLRAYGYFHDSLWF